MRVTDEMVEAAIREWMLHTGVEAVPFTMRPTLVAALAAAPQWIDVDDRRYEELRALIDGGSESMTHADAIEAVQIWREAYAAPAAPQWIACEERMPEEAENVVVCGVEDPPAVAYWYADPKGIQWCVSLTGDDITDVTHWMPLPAAPRSER